MCSSKRRWSGSNARAATGAKAMGSSRFAACPAPVAGKQTVASAHPTHGATPAGSDASAAPSRSRQPPKSTTVPAPRTSLGRARV